MIANATTRDDNKIDIRFDRRVLAVLWAIAGVIGIAGWSISGFVVQLRDDVRDVKKAIPEATEDRKEIVASVDKLAATVNEQAVIQNKQNERLVRMEEWRRLTSDWQAAVQDLNPSVIPPSPPDPERRDE